MSTRDGHDKQGRFTKENLGGPGRAPRPVERQYLAVLSDACTLGAWRDVVAKAVEDARAGDDKAREWLTRYLLGKTPMSLMELAKREDLGVEAGHEIAAAAEAVRAPGALEGLGEELDGLSPLRRALRLVEGDAR